MAVFRNSMVAHVWAGQRHAHGRSHNGQYYFEGRTLYSYGPHFVVGVVMPDGVTLVTTDKYSVTTSRHVALARQAAVGTCLQVPELTRLHPILTNLWDSPGARARSRPQIVQYVAEHALELEGDAALYLLGLVGRQRSWARLRREAEAAREKALGEQRRRQVAGRKARAERVAQIPMPAFRVVVDGWVQAGRHEEGLAELRALRAFARGHCGKRVQAALEARHVEARGRVRQADLRRERSQRLQQFRQIVQSFRKLSEERRERKLSTVEAAALFGCCRFFLDHARGGLISPEGRARLKALVEEARAEAREAEAREARERAEREREEREEWLAGRRSRWRGSGEVLLRAVGVQRDGEGRVVGGTLETSHGAEVPLVHALRVFRVVREVVASGQAWRANGRSLHVGHFRVDAIGAEGTLRAGCHTVHLPEMERLARALGLPADAGTH